MSKMLFAAALAAGLAGAVAAQAHVTLEQPEAPVGSTYKAVLRVGHGCEGAATTRLRVQIPEGVIAVKPMPKPGWTLELRREALAQPYESHGRTVTEDVVEVTWRAQTREVWLADAHYDEFVLRGQAPLTPGPAWFRVLQLCEKGQWDWHETPASGTATQGQKSPAVLLEVRPVAAKGPA